MTMASLKALSALSLEVEQKGQTLTDVMFLCDEWKSSKGGLSTFNREFAINLAAATTGSMKIHCYVLKSDDQDIEDAKQHGVNLIIAQTVPGSRDPIDWLKVPPPELQHPHIVIGHGRKLGRPAFFIARATGCQWIQFVHFFCEDLWKYKEIATAVDTIEEIEEKHKLEIELCRAADAVVAVGSHLQQKYSRSLPNVKVEIITPGIFGKFSGELKFAMLRSVPLVKNFSVFLFRADPFKDLSLKGYDIIANAVGSLGKNFELTFVGSSPGEHRKVERWFLDNTCINRNQLTIHGYCSGQEELKMMFYQSDLVALPSSTEGFGLVGLQAISAGVPLLVSGESGIGEALKEVEGGDTVIVGSDKDADEWARRIWEKSTEHPEDREASAIKLRENYRKVYSWKKECERFILMIKEVLKNADGTSLPSDMFTISYEKEQELPKTMRHQEGKESTGFQKDPHQKDSATSATAGSIVHPEIEDLKSRVLCMIAMNYLQTTPPPESREMFMQYLKEMKVHIIGISDEGRSPPSDVFTTGYEKEQEERKKLQEIKGRSPPSDVFTTGYEKEQEERKKLQERKGRSPPSDVFTTGYEKEQEERKKLQERKEFSTRNNKISVGRSKISQEGGVLMVQKVPAHVMIPSKALPTCTEVTCSLWNLQILSPPLGRNEALVSSVMELACESLPRTEEHDKFNVKVKLALSHSASDIKGYELVIKELIDEKTNEWRDLETRWAWTPSDIKDEHSSVEEFPDWLFPFAETEITSFSSFAVVWRLKSFTFENPSTLSSSFPCILSDHPRVSVTFPESSLPTGKTFALTVKVQEIPWNDTELKELLVAGPILHISPSEPVQLLAPAKLTVPITLREDISKFPNYSGNDVRIFCRTYEEDERKWSEVTKQLENIAVLENGTVTFTVNHFSEYWVWIDLLKLHFVILKNLADSLSRTLMLQRVGFLARLYATVNPTIYVLTLYCFPLHLEEQVYTRASLAGLCVRAQAEGNSLKPLCKGDWMSVSLSKAFTLMLDESLDRFLTFLGTDLFKRSLPVSVSDLSNLQVELYIGKEPYKETLCRLCFISTFSDQSSSPRNFAPTAQEATREKKEDQGALEFNAAAPSPKAPEETGSEEVLKVTILADEWNSLKGGLSTFNRELAIHLAGRSDTQVTLLVPHGACGEEEKAAAAEDSVTIIEAKKRVACSPLVELFFPPRNLGIDVVIGHGAKLGHPAQIIRESHDCKWIQVVHTAPDKLGMYKGYSGAITQSEEKNQLEVSLCEIADLVTAVGPKLKGFYSNRLRSYEKEQNVVQFTPGIMKDLTDVELSLEENDEFQVLMFGRGDDEDFELKGYDIAAEAFKSHELKNDSYHLTFVGAAPGKQDEFAKKLLKFGISKNQLSVKEYIKDRNRLKELLLRMDLVIMPSRTEGFGLTALEALSAGLPVLAGHNSGFSEALRKVEFGELCVVKSDEPEDWSKAIKMVRQKERKKRLKEMQRLRESYGKIYNWEEQCEILVREMRRKLFA